MKKIFLIYTIIGLIITPFIYSNSAIGYRPGSTGTKIGVALAGGFYWPSYLFSTELKSNGKSFEEFEQSLIDILRHRDEKLFSKMLASEDGNMLMAAIGSCVTSDYSENVLETYNKIFSKNFTNEEVDKIRLNLMNRMNEKTFSEIIEEGEKCKKEVLSNSMFTKPSTLKSMTTQEAAPQVSTEEANSQVVTEQYSDTVTVPKIDGNCSNAEEIIKSFGLEPNGIYIHGPIDEDAAGIGCAYRQDPKAGTLVPKGSTVTYRFWSEAS